MGFDGFRLLSRSAAEQLLQSGPEFREFLDRSLAHGGPVRRFPNGAVEIDGAKVGGDELGEAFRSCAATGREIEGAYVFQTLGPFAPKRYYCIQYPVAYQEKLRTEDSFMVGQGRIRPPAPGEFDLAHLEATVAFRTRVSKAVREAFVGAISTWARTAAERGAFDDGPVSLASPGIEFSGTRARFLLDASLSGQDTLNWLALAILDFGEDVHVVTGVFFGSSAEFLDAMIGPIRGEPVLVGFPRDRSPGASKRPVPAGPVGYVPPSATSYPGFESRRFPVLALPVDEWDSFVATIYFGRTLGEEEQEQLAALVDAWLLLGSYGGLGGAGTHSADKVKFDGATDSALIRADMGDTDPEIALRVLIGALEGYESTGPPIDALVLGRPGWTETDYSAQ
jgi:hypothetical protein